MTSDIDVYINSLTKRKPEDLIFLDLTGLDAIADFFIICHGKSTRQVTAIAEYVKSDLKKHSIRPISHEGFREGHWVILDYGIIVMHIFLESFRQFYNLEGLWSDAKIFEVNKNEVTDSISLHSINNYANFQPILID